MVLVTAEPGDPYEDESFDPAAGPEGLLRAACEHVYGVLRDGRDAYQRNISYILGGCFPGLTFDEQMQRTWLTDSVLCSAPKEGGRVDPLVHRECRRRFLEAQLGLFPRALVVALGGKAQRRLRDWPGVVGAYAVAPPGCNLRAARPSWDRVIEAFHTHVRGQERSTAGPKR
jgi:hypothetical protein